MSHLGIGDIKPNPQTELIFAGVHSMTQKLIVIAMLIATFGIGGVVYAQATGGSPGHQENVGKGEKKGGARPRRDDIGDTDAAARDTLGRT